MKNKITIVILVALLIVAIASCGLCHHTNGFKDWNFNETNKPTVEEPTQQPPVEQPPTIVEKQIVSTIIESEKYGTFELPANSLLLQNNITNMVFTDGTDFNFIWETELNKAKELNSSVTEESELVFEYNSYSSISEDMFAGVKHDNHNGHYYFVPENKVVKFIGSEEFKELYPILLNNCMNLSVTLPGNSSVTQAINVNFFCKNLKINYEDKKYIFANVIISDKGCPLADYIYDEIMSDSTTKITYLDSDGVEIPRV